MGIKEVFEWVYVKRKLFAFACIIIIAVFVRLFGFGGIPGGLNQDEISAGYEAYSLVTTGADRWGNIYPAYFPSWGSGQNVLYSYLSIPFIAIFGMNEISVRLLALFIGIFTVILLYATVTRVYGTRVGLMASFILAISPWHVMASRWGLESNLLPFFILLGLYLFVRLVQSVPSRRSNFFGVFALVPFALALYAYGIGFLVVFPLLLILVLANIKTLITRMKLWICALGMFLIVSLPFLLFMLKNYIIKSSFGFEQYLPITIPLLPSTRLSETSSNVLASNAGFVLQGFNDHLIWNAVPGYLPLSIGVLVLAFVGVILVLLRKAKNVLGWKVDPFLVWLICCMPLFFIVSLNINRANAIYIPLIVLAALAAVYIYERISAVVFRRIFIGAFFLYMAFTCVGALLFYLGPSYSELSKQSFSRSLDVALPKASELSNKGRLYVTESIPLNYVQTLWYMKVPPATFQLYHPTFNSNNFQHYIFKESDTKDVDNLFYIVRLGDKVPCRQGETLQTIDQWVIGRCIKG